MDVGVGLICLSNVENARSGGSDGNGNNDGHINVVVDEDGCVCISSERYVIMCAHVLNCAECGSDARTS